MTNRAAARADRFTVWASWSVVLAAVALVLVLSSGATGRLDAGMITVAALGGLAVTGTALSTRAAGARVAVEAGRR